MKDPIGNRGFAVVLPKSSTLGVLSNYAEKRRQFDAQMDLKRQDQAQDWFDKNSKINWKDVDYRVQKPLTDLYSKTVALMNGAYRQSGGRLTPDLTDQVNQAKMSFDASQQLASSFSNEIKQVDEILKSDKHNRYNKGYVAQMLQQNSDQAWTTDEIGLPKWNQDLKTPMEILKDPKAINIQGLISEYLDNIETVEAAQTEDMGNYTQTSTYKFKPALYEVDKDGLPKFDDNTGKYIPKASPQSVALWDQDSDRKTQLDLLADQNKLSRADAFKKFVIEPSAAVSKKNNGGRDYKPEYVAGPKKEQEQVDLVYPILEGIVEKGDKDALQQLAGGNERYKFEYSHGTTPGVVGKGDKPKEIIVYKYQPIEKSIFSRLNESGESTTKSEWVEYDRVDLGNKEEAFSSLSQYFDEANDTKLSQSIFKKRRESNASKRPQKTKADQYGLN